MSAHLSPLTAAPDAVLSTLTITKAPQEHDSAHASEDELDSPHTPRRISFACSTFAAPVPPPRRRSPSPTPRAVASLTPQQVCRAARAPPAAAAFTPVPDDVYLPFVDRPAEVAALLAAHGLARLVRHDADRDARGAGAAGWSGEELERWLTRVDRDEAADAEWVAHARACLAARSELLWQRVKHALGVPPELDGEESRGGGSTRIEPLVHGVTTPRDMADIAEDGPPLESPPVPLALPTALRIRAPPAPSTRLHRSTPPTPPASASPNPNPLFPSSFANLTVGPTLKANNPALRAPPLSTYPSPGRLCSQRPHPSLRWADAWDPRQQQYAVSVTSSG